MRDHLLSEERLLALAAGGERTLARARMIVVACFFAVPVVQALRSTQIDTASGVGLVAGATALLIAALLLLAAEREADRAWLSYVTAVTDVTLVSGALALLLILGEARAAVNDSLLWGLYLLAIAGAALRPRRGMVIVATAVAVVEYLGIVLYASRLGGLGAPASAPFASGLPGWGAQFARLGLMGTAGLLAYALVRRTGRLTQLAGSDALTGALNRALFELRLAEEVQRARRHRRALTLAMIDLDNLKALNDELGHDCGDIALVRVAHALRADLRASDSIFRYGGDEFAVLLPEAHADEARARIARIATQLRSRPLEGRMLTLSVGIASIPADASGAGALLRAADRKLYEAKRGGRDCIRLAERA